jgi:hypothetical protein
MAAMAPDAADQVTSAIGEKVARVHAADAAGHLRNQAKNLDHKVGNSDQVGRALEFSRLSPTRAGRSRVRFDQPVPCGRSVEARPEEAKVARPLRSLTGTTQAHSKVTIYPSAS